MKVLIKLLGTLFLHFLLETGVPLYVVIQAMQRSSHLQGKAVLLSYFKTLSTGPAAPRIKPVTSLTP